MKDCACRCDFDGRCAWSLSQVGKLAPLCSVEAGLLWEGKQCPVSCRGLFGRGSVCWGYDNQEEHGVLCLFEEEVHRRFAVFIATIQAAGFESVFVWLLYLEGGVEGSWPHAHKYRCRLEGWGGVECWPPPAVPCLPDFLMVWASFCPFDSAHVLLFLSTFCCQLCWVPGAGDSLELGSLAAPGAAFISSMMK